MPKIVKDEDVFLAVMKIVSERGYSGATTKQMAEAAKVSEMTLFRKYGNKAELVKQAISTIIGQTDLAASAHYTGDLKSDLTRIVQAYQDSAVEHGNFITSLFSEMSRHPELVSSIDRPLNIFMAIGELIARYQEEGYLKQEPPLHTVGVLLGPVMYTAILRKVIPESSIPPLDISVYVANFLTGRKQ